MFASECINGYTRNKSQYRPWKSGPNWYQTGNKTFYIPHAGKFYVEKRISLLTGLKVSSLASKETIRLPWKFWNLF